MKLRDKLTSDFAGFLKPCFPRKEFTSIAGPTKNGKTFFTSMVMACCIRQQVMSLERIRKEPLRVKWYDTEQSRNTTKEILAKRIGRMIGGTGTFPDEHFFVFNPGELPPLYMPSPL